MSTPHTCKHDAETLNQLQALPLSQKVFESRQRIAEWVEHWGEDKVYVAFSGGKDSTVLLDIVRRDYPDIPAVFVNTGLEFPEIVKFVRTVENVTWLKPKMNFKEVIEKYGYPVVAKRVADYVGRCQKTESKQVLRRHIFGENADGSSSPSSKIPVKWQELIDAPFKISDKCCEVMKKRPIQNYSKSTGRLSGIVGIMANESMHRTLDYYQHGCNSFDSKSPLSRPLSFWTESDIWDYINSREIPHSPIYDMGYNRTGCTFCMFGCHLEGSPNRFQRMKRTHPKLHNYCMNKLGLKEVLEFCNVPTGIDDLMQGEFDFAKDRS